MREIEIVIPDYHPFNQKFVTQMPLPPNMPAIYKVSGKSCGCTSFHPTVSGKAFTLAIDPVEKTELMGNTAQKKVAVELLHETGEKTKLTFILNLSATV